MAASLVLLLFWMALRRSPVDYNDSQRARSRCWPQGIGMQENNQPPV
ncbi:hypothetical protein [Synechococcus sp. MIT S9508]|nr:hypothetical protein [Synechococcus sp. MIT S9508]